MTFTIVTKLVIPCVAVTLSLILFILYKEEEMFWSESIQKFCVKREKYNLFHK